MDHVCPHEQDFGDIKARLKALEKIMYDNGTKGLQTQLIELNANIESEKKLKEELRVNVSSLVKFMNSIEVEKATSKQVVESRRAEEDRKRAEERTKQANAFKTIAVVISIVSVLITVIFKYL